MPLSEFHRNASMPDGHKDYCKHCIREMQRQTRERKKAEQARIQELIESIKSNIAELRSMGWQCTVTLTYPKTIKI